MTWEQVSDNQLSSDFLGGWTYSEIAKQYRTTRNAVAGRCKRLGLVRDVAAAEERERKRDQRDIDILCDLEEGHSQRDCAKHYGVGQTYVSDLSIARGKAG